MNKTIAFLKKNGFKKMEQNSYANEFCNIVLEKNHYVVTNNSWGTMYSNDLNIYWLIGVLTYYDFMNKDYKK